MRPAPLFLLTVSFVMMAQSADSDVRRAAPRRSSRASVDVVDCGLNNDILFLRESPTEEGEWGNLPRVWLEIANREDRPLWIAIHLTSPFPDRVCDRRLALGPGKLVRTLCTQDSVAAGVDYTLDATAFPDSGYQELLDSSSWTFQLRKSEVAEWMSRRAAAQDAPAVSAGSDGAAISPPSAPPKPVNHTALHLAIQNAGISFGNAPIVHGLRFNWRDEELQQVDGLNFVILSAPSPNAKVHGIEFSLGPTDANSVAPYVGEIWGLGLSLSSVAAVRSRGIMIGLIHVGSQDAAGIHVSGLIMSGNPAVGLQASTLVWGGPLTGVNLAGLFGWSEYGPMTGVNIGGLGVLGQQVSGLSLSGLAIGAQERIQGISVAGLFVGGQRMTGIQAASFVRTDDLTGLSIGGGNYVGVQRGVTIGLINRAEELHGVQIGIFNIAENNSGAMSKLPILNFHLGK